MATKKENTTKKAETKKKATTKKPTKKAEVVEEPIVTGTVEATEEIIGISEPAEIGVNGDTAVVTPIEEPIVEEKVIEEPKVEEKPAKKITKKISQNFGYIWNGQMIEF
jgi:hypothetical protein